MDGLPVSASPEHRGEMSADADRRFEIRQANALLAAMIASSDDGTVEESMSTLATLAGLTRVQAQIGLKVLKRRGRILHDRRGTRKQPGRFRVISDELVSLDVDDLTRAVTPRLFLHDENGPEPSPAAVVGHLIQENDALKRDLQALSGRLDVVSEQLRRLEQMVTRPGGSHPGAPAVS
jgi:hypothetical protein